MAIKDKPIKEKHWKEIKRLLEDASKKDKKGDDLRKLFDKRTNEKKAQKLEKLGEYGITEDDLKEIHRYLENIFHDSPLKFWWW
ncbi:MAG: hypothetical protein ACE5JF_10245 [Anaerolineales bacterium]